MDIPSNLSPYIPIDVAAFYNSLSLEYQARAIKFLKAVIEKGHRRYPVSAQFVVHLCYLTDLQMGDTALGKEPTNMRQLTELRSMLYPSIVNMYEDLSDEDKLKVLTKKADMKERNVIDQPLALTGFIQALHKETKMSNRKVFSPNVGKQILTAPDISVMSTGQLIGCLNDIRYTIEILKLGIFSMEELTAANGVRQEDIDNGIELIRSEMLFRRDIVRLTRIAELQEEEKLLMSKEERRKNVQEELARLQGVENEK